MELNIFQKGFNYSQDGPGNRLVYHLQGCNMRCPWCANPEGLDRHGTLLVQPELLLESVCPHGAIGNRQLDRSLCMGCQSRECIGERRNQGIRLSCAAYPLEELLDEAQSSRALFTNGGGVTLTGGEATLQFEAVREFLKGLKAAGIHTALESNATHPELEMLFPWIDSLILDVKHYNEDVLRRVTGVGLDSIRPNLEKALAGHPDLLIRIPLIRGFNDSEEDIQGFCTFFMEYKPGKARFEFLPYHEYGKPKWEQCGLTYPMTDGFIRKDTLDGFIRAFGELQLTVVHT